MSLRPEGPVGSPNLTHPTDAAEVHRVIRARSSIQPRLGIILGSGFGVVVDAVRAEVVLPFSDLPGLASCTVPGHAAKLVLGELSGMEVAIWSGRLHYYEGHSWDAVTLPIRVLHLLGASSVLLTNAAGGIREDLVPGDFVALSDHLNFMGGNPLRGPGASQRFVDLSQVYCPRLRSLLRQAGGEEGIDVKEGVYLAVGGPSYETPAEIRAFRAWGADLVGMSTVPEAIVARHCGMAVAGLSCVTNKAAGLGGAISHGEVLDVGRQSADRAVRLLGGFVRRLHESES